MDLMGGIIGGRSPPQQKLRYFKGIAYFMACGKNIEK